MSKARVRWPERGERTYQGCHEHLLMTGFKPVPGSSRYEMFVFADAPITGRVVAGPGTGDEFHVEIEWEVSAHAA